MNKTRIEQIKEWTEKRIKENNEFIENFKGSHSKEELDELLKLGPLDEELKILPDILFIMKWILEVIYLCYGTSGPKKG